MVKKVKIRDQSLKYYGFTNDGIFGSIMQNKRYCKAIIQAALPDVKVISVQSVAAQKEFGTKSDKSSKSVRLDIAVKDQDGNLYDVEMQVNNNHDIGPRMRYYQSSMDRDTLDRGEPYTSLSRTYLIFLCAFDPFNKGRLRYSFHLYDDDDKDICLKNNAENIIINSKGKNDDEQNVALLNLQRLMNDDKIKTKGVFQEIQKTIDFYNKDPKRRRHMRTAELRLKEETAVASRKGEKRGKREAEKNAIKMFKKLMPHATKEEAIKWLRENTEISLTDEEIAKSFEEK